MSVLYPLCVELGLSIPVRGQCCSHTQGRGAWTPSEPSEAPRIPSPAPPSSTPCSRVPQGPLFLTKQALLPIFDYPSASGITVSERVEPKELQFLLQSNIQYPHID